MIAGYAMFMAALTCSLLVRAVERRVEGIPLSGPSRCQCGRRVGWIGLIPVLGYLARLGRCRLCLRRIPPRYPILEAAWAAPVGALAIYWEQIPHTTRTLSLLLLLVTAAFSLAFTALAAIARRDA